MWTGKVCNSPNYKYLSCLTFSDFAIITTEDGTKPTMEQARNAPRLPVNEEALAQNELGRGSMVWFNQATMFQSSELDIRTVKEGMGMGINTTTNVQEWLKKKVFMNIPEEM